MSEAVEKPRILVVDDEPTVVRSLNWLFQRDYRVTTATGGREAIELLNREKDFAVILSDCRMPEVTGIDVLREAREKSPLTTRILLTGYADLDAVVGSVNEGEVFRYINKPWDNDELRRVVTLALEEHHRASMAAAATADEASSTYDILVVDRSPATVNSIIAAAGDGCGIVHAESLEKAVDVLGTRRIGIIVSDLEGSNPATVGLVREMKRKHPEVVIIILSEQNDANLIIDLINELHVFRFLPKPVRPSLLKITLRSAFSKLQNVTITTGRGDVGHLAAAVAGEAAAIVQQLGSPAAPRDGERKGLLHGLMRLFGGR